jgi:hypothetical protein
VVSGLQSQAPRSVVIAFGADGNSDAFVGEGWSAPEPQHRWSEGRRGVLRLPRLLPSRRFALTIEGAPLPFGPTPQTLALELNGVALGAVQPKPGAPQTFIAPGEMLNASGDNMLVVSYPDALVPAQHAPDNGETRQLAFAWTRLELGPEGAAPFAQAQPLAAADPAELPIAEVASLFQSLGQNCELGLFQRRCGAEPNGLLRFASIFPGALVRGLRTRFAGLEDVQALALTPGEPGGELIGRHAVYGLDYHTFRREREVEASVFRANEARRLVFLARMLIEQAENDDKIFVRRGDFQAPGERLALHRLLRAFNPHARLLIVEEAQRADEVGRVERLGADLYRGYVSKFADTERVADTLVYEDWLKICATLYLDQREAGRV